MPQSAHRPHSRQGAALILSLVILSALIALGLPFVFSMVSGLAGARTFQARTQVSTARDSAVDLALGVAAEGAGAGLSDDTVLHTLIDEQIDSVWGTDVAAIPTDAYPHQIVVTVADLGLDFNQTPTLPSPEPTVAMLLEDEHAKLDPNSLDVAGWATLLAQVGINDWDDNAAPDSDDRNGTPSDSDGDGVEDNDDGGAFPGSFNDDGDDSDGYGELAESLARLRFSFAGNRITRLDQLLNANPGHNSDDNSSGASYQYGTTNDPVSGSFGFRRPLTRAELALLRPYLTMHTLGQGRDGGVIDVGTIIASNGNDRILDIDEDMVQNGGDSGHDTLVVTGTVLVGGDRGSNGDWDVHYRTNGGWVSRWAGDSNTDLSIGDPVGIEVQPTVNLHHIPAPVAAVTLGASQPDSSSFPLTTPLAATAVSAGGSGSPTGFTLMNPLASGRERQAVDIAGLGIVTTDVGATAFDPAGRPLAQAARRQVVQATPEESVMNFAWRSQDQFDVHRARRFTNGIATWPIPTNRLTDVLPSDVATAADTGLRTAVLPNFATVGTSAANLAAGRTWSRRLTGTTSSMLENGSGSGAPASGTGYDEDDLTPDGLTLSSSTLGWLLDDSSSAPLASTGSLDEINGRSLSLWIQPTADWSTGSEPVPIAGILAASGEIVRPQIDNTPGDTRLQNDWQLEYHPDAEYLVLRLANAAIEQTNDLGISVPLDDQTDATALTNEESLGSDAANARPLAPAMPWNHSALYYKIQGGFDQARWYHIQVVVAHDRPGGQVILVDGNPGRDATKLAATASLRFGDYQTLPSLVLDQDLPADVIESTGGSALTYSTIALRSTNVLDDLISTRASGSSPAEFLLPERGTVLIGNEYITYSDVNSTGLIGCYRALRTNANQGSGTLSERWPGVEAHLTGDLVVPGGFRFRPGSGDLLRGAVELADDLPNGDPDVSSDHQWRHWGRLSLDHNDFDADHRTLDKDGDGLDDPDGVWELWLDIPSAVATPTTDIPLQGTVGFLTQLPSAGLIVVSYGGNRQLWWYDRFASDQFLDLTSVVSGGGVTSANEIRWRDDIDPEDAPEVWLISLEVADHSWTEPVFGGGSYTKDTILDALHFTQTGSHDQLLLQVEDLTTRRIEWIHYDATLAIISDITGVEHHLFVDLDGFDASSRGQQRTAFAGNEPLDPSGIPVADPALPVADSSTFPAGSRIMPVQTNGGAVWHWMVSGDVVTWMPDTIDLTSPTTTPFQLAIRFAATDHYPVDPSLANAGAPYGDAWDTKNEWFTLSQPLPPLAAGETWDMSTIEFLSGTCWSGRDLSTLSGVGATALAKGLMPRLAGFATDYDLSAGAPQFIWGGGVDSTGAAVVSNIAIDAPVTATISGASVGNGDLGLVTAFDGGTTLSASTAVSLSSPVRVTADVNAFTRVRGLVRIGGEVFAFIRVSNDEADLVGRGLLGSTAVEHRIQVTADPDGGSDDAIIGPSVITLPLGPVAILDGDLTSDFQGQLPIDRTNLSGNTLTTQWRYAPAAMVVANDGSRAEMLFVTREDQNLYTAPWMRGAYHTTPWDAPAGSILIGWWPRYPSALPDTSSTTWSALSTAEQSAMLRCRRYPWISLVLRCHDTVFPDGSSVAGIDATSTSTAGGIMRLRARALAEGWDWSAASEVDSSSLADVFGWSAFDDPVDGGEARLFWRYNPGQAPLLNGGGSTFLQDLAERTSAQPAIESFSLSASARHRVLSVEQSR